MDRLRVHRGKLTDAAGRQVLLSGLNLVCKQPSDRYIGPWDRALFDWLRSQGHNLVRLGLIWDGVEPEPGTYDEDYLDRVGHTVRLAREYDVYVLLDMHQDLYSRLFGDGAPAWATITDGLRHAPQELWSDAYWSSPALLRAADRFWEDAPAPDGDGLQTHYARMWAHAVRRIGDCENIVGYDLMNEPFPGSAGARAFAEGAAGLPDGREAMLRALSDPQTHLRAAQRAAGAAQEFERGPLAGLYRRVAAQLRLERADAALALEPSYCSNIGVESGVCPVDGWEGGQLYAPHGYDFVVDTLWQDFYDHGRVERVFAAHRRVQERLGLPVLLGEWGGFYGHPMRREQRRILRIVERNLWSHAYWCWYPGCEEEPCTKALCRAYPQATAGELLSYSYDPDSGAFRMEFIPDGGETLLYHPLAGRLTARDVRLDSGAPETDLSQASRGRVAVRAPRSAGPCALTIRPAGDGKTEQ